uniref:Uncharacterized protein n=1 Tax=Chlorobium chlorochromatii (strain CaD3) TaxID=340177 RepID=Q3AT70_CHLCH
MHPETAQIVHAIESLKQAPNFIKDYIFPIANAFFTSLLGAGIAYFTLRYQEVIQIEKDKMDTVNKWTLLVDEARSSLLAIKSNYHGNLTDSPIQRALAIRTVLFTATPINEEYLHLFFLIPKATEKKCEYQKWSQISIIRTMVLNYNNLLKLWIKRNEVERPIKEKLLQKYSQNAYADVNTDQIIECIGAANFASLVDLTEHVIKLTDDLLVEFDNFLHEFPNYAKTLINTKRLKRYGSILTYSNNSNKKLLSMLEKSPTSNYESVIKLFGMTVEQLREKYKTGYEL